jgi:hypothetical protein
MELQRIRRREPAIVLLLGILTFGIYMPFWYHGIYQDLQQLDGRTPTGHGFWLDFFLAVLTGGIYGVWVDYQISQQLKAFQEREGLHPVQDTGLVSVVLDLAAYITVFITFYITSAIQQDQLNRLVERLEAKLPASAAPA